MTASLNAGNDPKTGQPWTEQAFAEECLRCTYPGIEALLRNAAYNSRAAAKKQKNELLWDYFKFALLLGAVAIAICAYNGIWEPFWYVTAPITLPLLLLYAGFSSIPAIPPIAVVIGLLIYIAIRLDSKK